MPVTARAPPCAASPRADGYERRRPEETLLHRVVTEHWPDFLERAEQAGGLPAFVTKEFEAYLECGLLEHGFVQLACQGCGEELFVAFSCKRRGFCPSCVGRRMSDVAAHLVDEVFPEDVPIRQWVCSLPWRLRYVLGYDRALCADVLQAFIDALKQCLRRRAKREFGLGSVKDAQVGAVTVVQRSDSALRLNVHFHTLAADGVWVRDGDGGVRFRELPPPTADDVGEVASRTHQKLLRVLARHGRSLEGIDDVPDTLADEQPVLASCYDASASDVSLLGERAGQRTGKLTGPVSVALEPSGAVAEVGGVNVHAKVRVEGWDRRGLERLCRYIARPPLALERLSENGDGRLRYTLKSRWRDGTSAVLLEPLDLIARLCALIPAPRFHMLRYHGVFAGNAKWRGEVVPGPTPEVGEQPALLDEDQGGPAEAKRPRRHPWAYLLSRVFGVDITECPRCGGRLRVVEVVSEPADIARVLHGQVARAPPPELFGQLVFDFAA